ncbi:hypothetical protein [Rhizobium sp. Root149]|uniref:hypothetical protein n=1 Tax=Rhizobium sp. Root149 TaxID=1736473 RepID=UPI0012E3AE65|nr:hypothetical protein [Rhizobium sp. Root149]
MTQTHTPLPWAENNDLKYFEVWAKDDEANDRHIICALEGPDAKANAAFIVTACNSYYDNQATIASQAAEIAALREALKSAEAEVKKMRDRYERWMPVSEEIPHGMSPYALLHFYCINDHSEGDESPEYWFTGTWREKPKNAVYWCAIVSPLGPHETTFIARAALEPRS